MTNLKSILAATAAIAVMGAPAFAGQSQPQGWYIGAGAGGNWAQDLDTLTTFSSSTLEVETDEGWAVVGSVGKRFDNSLRLELELGYRENDVDAVIYGGIPQPVIGGDVTQTSLMLNALFDIPITEKFGLSLGAGIGGAWVDLSAGTFVGPTFSTWLTEDDEGFYFAYQGIAEASYDITSQVELFASYRYHVVSDVDVITFPNGIPLDGQTDIDNHTALIGLRYFFAPAAAAPAPEPEPVAGCAQQTFLVFFDFNKANLTADAAGVVAEAATAYKAGCSVVLVVGHTDTVGSMSYNQDLSERRAASVKAEMVNQGVPADAISTEGRSFSDPLVPTGPGVKEAQNRRAVISVQ